MVAFISALYFSFVGLAAAKNRIFSEIGETDCQFCLAEVENECRGPISSKQFNNCFCAVGEDGKAWNRVKKCLTDSKTSCKEDEYDILSYWGSHCFAYKDDEEEEVCVDSSQDDKILMTVVDSFCTEFVTLSSDTSTSSTPTGSSTPVDTESDISSPTVLPETTSEPAEPSSTADDTNESEETEGASSDDTDKDDGSTDGDQQDDDDEEEHDGAGILSPLSVGTASLLALYISGFVMNLM